MSIRYVTIQEFSSFHQVDIHLIETFIHFGLLEPLDMDNQYCIREEDIEPLEAMVRLHTELDVNLPDLETIMHMRQRLLQLQARVEELEGQLRWYENRFAARPAFSGWEEAESQ